jgi:hypothetical protein
MSESIATVAEQRELVELLLEQVADARRARKAQEAARDEATKAERAALAAAAEPFTEPLARAAAEEAEAVASATEALVDWLARRRQELIAGRECLEAKPPAGVSVQWRDKPRVTDPESIPAELLELVPDMKAIGALLKAGQSVAGAELERLPVIVDRGPK